MKIKFTKEKAVPVPARVRGICLLVCSLLMAGTVTVSAVAHPREIREHTPHKTIEPCHIEQLVEMAATTDASEDKNEDKIKTKTPIAIVVTEEIAERHSTDFGQEYKISPDLQAGQTAIATNGEPGIEEVIKKVTTVNGEKTEEEVVRTNIIKAPVNRQILVGSAAYEGYAKGNIVEEPGVSYVEDGVYSALRVPVDEVCISSPYGPRWGTIHYGVDFASPMGDAIYAADDGVVYYAGNNGGYGNMIKLDHGNGMQTYYAHCIQLLAVEGQQVKKGDVIAYIGSTGYSTGPHLHFEVIVNGARVDPLNLLEIEPDI